jgi:hypothetical protein
MWMSAWAYTYDEAPDFQEQQAVARRATAALKEEFGTEYTTGSVANVIYLVSGCASDYAYDAGIKLSYSVELRGPDVSAAMGYGFMIPADQIVPTGTETLRAVEQLGLHLWEEKTGKPHDYSSGALGTNKGSALLGAFCWSVALGLFLLIFQ